VVAAGEQFDLLRRHQVGETLSVTGATSNKPIQS
jgi:hypothetical protein